VITETCNTVILIAEIKLETFLGAAMIWRWAKRDSVRERLCAGLQLKCFVSMVDLNVAERTDTETCSSSSRSRKTCNQNPPAT
jgi:hypothetical protein